MGFWDNLRALFTPPTDLNAMWLYVKCQRCGTPLAVRVDLRNELSADYEGNGYILHKEMMDSQCFTLMHAQVRFDATRKIVEQKIDPGEFITQADYAALTSAQ